MLVTLSLCSLLVHNVLAFSSDSFRLFGAQSVNIWRLQQHSHKAISLETLAALSPIVQSTFTQPLDHFDSRNPFTFKQRYWANPTFYRSGGPVIVLDGGETSGEDRLPFLLTGIAAKLANATGGLALVLEHRYYGDSIPVANFSTDALRWLTNEQAAADSANFLANADFKAIGINGDLTAPKTPWIYYGGSYAGARSAHMRVLYPNLVYGAIASSGVTYASVSIWQYFDVVRNAAPTNCSSVLVQSVEAINSALTNPQKIGSIKALFGCQDLADDDFSSLISFPLGFWQGHNWNPAIDQDLFTPFCEGLLAKPSQQVTATGNAIVNNALANYGAYIQANFITPCLQQNQTVNQCFGTTNDTVFQLDDLSQTWRAWQYQVCTTWGYFADAPPDNVPPIAAKPLTVPYLAKICKQAYPPGQFNTVPSTPNVTAVNVLGGFNIAADRLAIIDGENDPWRPATPHSSYNNLPPRPDTTLRPFKLILGAVHHWDENGLADTNAEPPTIKAIHEQEIAFVQAWLQDFKAV